MPNDENPVQPTHFPNGSEWVRVDFHLHTKADREFIFTDAEDTFINQYVEALEKAEIKLGVVTNHNKFDLIQFKAIRKAARKKGIGLLPGVELSIGEGKGGVHTLVVFSEQWIEEGANHIGTFLMRTFSPKLPGEYENENARSNHKIIETLKQLKEVNKDFFVIFAHVEQDSGLWKETDGASMTALAKEPLFRSHVHGFQKVQSADKSEAGKPDRVKVKNWLKDAYPAEVEGSDPKSIGEIGKGKKCFLKIGELSFDAVKFALGDPASRVAAEVKPRAASHILSIQFDGGILDGQVIQFSPEMNTMIGVRGSGKSAILEAIRYVLDIPRGEKASDTKYKDELIKHTLGSGGKITLMAKDTHGQQFKVSRIYREAPNVYVDDKLQPGVTIRETVLRNPIYFGQKDLSTTGDGFETDLVEKLVGEKLRQLRAEIESRRQKVKDEVVKLQRLTTTEEQKREYQAQLDDANFRLQKFEEYGIAGKLQKRVGFLQDESIIKQTRGLVEKFTTNLSDFIAKHEDDLRNARGYVSQQSAEFFVKFFGEYSAVTDQLDKIKGVFTEVTAVSKKLDVKQLEFAKSLQSVQEEFAEVERKLADELKQSGAITVRPDDFLADQKRKTQAMQMLDALSKQELQKLTVNQALITELEKLNELWRTEFKAIKAELDRVNGNNNSLQIEADFKGDKEAAIGFMQQMYRGTGIREATLRSIIDIYADFGDVFKNLDKVKKSVGGSAEVFESTFFKHLSDFLTWQVPNQFRIKFRGKELKNHSLGQRASALILYVLSQKQNDVIIIDQPEDDLDNQTIYDDVIKLIREMKPFTQFIFATHNPNFPVLGDAEQVHACSYQDDRVKIESGGIDSRPIQQAIINIMEGGEEAFNRRKDVYNLWKPQS